MILETPLCQVRVNQDRRISFAGVRMPDAVRRLHGINQACLPPMLVVRTAIQD
jgi:hypothetical protein